jgi:2-polyprenyl-3-methyl-5-hydroxy-6-metoxy-1,4-benzoquinol methylase
MDPEPSEKQITSHYSEKIVDGNYELFQRFNKEYNKVYKSFIEIIKKNLEKDKKHMQGANLLDIGCFTGEFLYLANQEGSDVTGYELQKEAVEIANKKLPGKIHQTSVYNDDIKPEQFDIITLFGVLEHVLEPLKLLKKIKSLLKKDGYLFIQTPNSGSAISVIMGRSWPPISPIEHIHLFSKIFLTKWLKEQNLEILNVYNHWKFLPINYVYENLSNFGPDIKKIIKPFYLMLPNFITRQSLPFYGGEMILVIKK